MKTAPKLDTERLVLRSLLLEDAQDVQRLAGERDVASTVLRIPHPYEDGVAEKWIASCAETFEKGEGVHFAITLRADRQLIGVIGLEIERDNEKAELGYWIGKPYWNSGYCTEAAKAVVPYGFQVLELNRIYAYHLTRNPASGRVLKKIGMLPEECLRQHVKKWGQFEDVMAYGLLKADFNSDA